MLHERFVRRQSPIHRVDPRVKVLWTVGFVLTISLLPNAAWESFALAWGVTVLLATVARLGWSYALRRSFVAVPFALAAVSVLFLPGPPLWRLPGGWTISSTGVARFLSVLLRSWIAVQAAVLLTAVTPFPDLIHALHHLRLPALLVHIIAFMVRYLRVLADEAQRMLRARAARSAALPERPSGGRWTWRARVAGYMVGQLFLRSYERAERIYRAMEARGYQGRLLTLTRHRLTSYDAWALLGGAALWVLVWFPLWMR